MQNKFNIWLDNLLSNKPLPDNVMAINFNVYEMADTFDVQLIASSIYDENDDDWACEEIYSSKEDCFYIPRSKELYDSELALELVEEYIGEYILSGTYKEELTKGVAICAGLVDGQLDCIWSSDDE